MNPVILFPSPSAARAPAPAVWLALSAVAFGSGFFFSTNSWFEGLAKPEWTPPFWSFAPAWFLLFTLMAASAWLVWREGGWRRQALALSLFLMQFLLSALWAPVAFGLQWTGWAVIDLLLLWAAIAAGMAYISRAHQVAALLLAPCLTLVTFAVMVNAAIWQMNR